MVTPRGTLAVLKTSRLARPGGDLEYVCTGSGEPRTIFAHGLASSIPETRPFGSGVRGTKAFFHFRGHGASSAPESDWTYAALARELDDVARHVGATRALGVSMGAGALCRLVGEDPARFERLVLVIPAVVDQPRTDRALDRLLAMGQLVEDRDAEGVAEVLLSEQPPDVRTDPRVTAWAADQARLLVGTPVSRALRSFPGAVPLDDAEPLRAVQAPVLVIGQEDDPVHPLPVARRLAELFPTAQLEVLPPGGLLWTHRAHVRHVVSQFLNNP